MASLSVLARCLGHPLVFLDQEKGARHKTQSFAYPVLNQEGLMLFPMCDIPVIGTITLMKRYIHRNHDITALFPIKKAGRKRKTEREKYVHPPERRFHPPQKDQSKEPQDPQQEQDAFQARMSYYAIFHALHFKRAFLCFTCCPTIKDRQRLTDPLTLLPDVRQCTSPNPVEIGTRSRNRYQT